MCEGTLSFLNAQFLNYPQKLNHTYVGYCINHTTTKTTTHKIFLVSGGTVFGTSEFYSELTYFIIREKFLANRYSEIELLLNTEQTIGITDVRN
jgi:hypothetical protein